MGYYDMDRASRSTVRRRMVERAYLELPDADTGSGNMAVNVGWGIPLGLVDVLAEHGRSDVLLNGESCAIGMGAYLHEGDEYDMHMVDPAGIPYRPVPGGCHTRTLTDSFAFINSGKLAATVLGAFQVAANGDFANWDTGDGAMKAGPGGACALARGAQRVIICMVECDRNGERKLVHRCTLPLTARGAVDLVITDAGVYRPAGEAFEQLEVYDESLQQYVPMQDA